MSNRIFLEDSEINVKCDACGEEQTFDISVGDDSNSEDERRHGVCSMCNISFSIRISIEHNSDFDNDD